LCVDEIEIIQKINLVKKAMELYVEQHSEQ